MGLGIVALLTTTSLVVSAANASAISASGTKTFSYSTSDGLPWTSCAPDINSKAKAYVRVASGTATVGYLAQNKTATAKVATRNTVCSTTDAFTCSWQLGIVA